MKVCTSTTSSCIEENLQKLCDCPHIYGKNYSLYMFILRFIVMLLKNRWSVELKYI